MPGDAFQTVLPGQKLAIPAMAYNAFLDAARYVRGRLQEGEGDDDREFRNSGIVLVRNDSGADRDRFDVLGITGPVITPGESLQQFQNRVALAGASPAESERGRFVILIEPLREGAMGRAVVSGVTVGRVWINPEDEDGCCADVSDGDTQALHVRAGGAAQILWREAGYGLKWAVLRLGSTCLCDPSSSSSSSSSSSGPTGVEVQETDIRCESGLLNVYVRIITLRIENGQLARDEGEWQFDHEAGCCECGDDSSSSSSSGDSSSSDWSGSGFSA